MEIETKDAAMPLRDLYGILQGTAAYLIAKGPIIRDGDTIGHTAQQQIRVRHGKSYWRADKVYRLDFGGQWMAWVEPDGFVQACDGWVVGRPSNVCGGPIDVSDRIAPDRA